MRPSTLLSLSTALLPPTTATQHPKRGLCHVPSPKHPNDDKIWITGSTPPTWYYNYQSTPSPAYLHSQTPHFVPMLWGASPTDKGTPFYNSIASQLRSGKNITHVLTFNEPDGPFSTGGSALPADLAAARWKAEIEPLRDLGVKVGLPAVTGGESGWAWMEGFFAACGGKCTPDFIPVHWYGDFEGMMSHVGRVTVAYPWLEVWVTEFGFPGWDRETTEGFFLESASAFDGWRNVSRYAYFGAFRADVSNVGPGAAMLDGEGRLTSIGAWYVGGVAAEDGLKESMASSMTSPAWSAWTLLFACWVFLVWYAVDLVAGYIGNTG